MDGGPDDGGRAPAKPVTRVADQGRRLRLETDRGRALIALLDDLLDGMKRLMGRV